MDNKLPENIPENEPENNIEINTDVAVQTGTDESANNIGDDFVIGEGFAINTPEDEPKPEATGTGKKKTANTIKPIIWVVSIIVISVLLACGILLVGAEYLGLGVGRGEQCVVEIEQGMSTAEIAQRLKDVNAINNTYLFRIYTKLKKYDGQYKYGVYTFKNECGYEELTDMLLNDGAVAETVRVTIPEMSTIDEMAKILDEAGVCTAGDFKRAVANTELKYDFIDEIPTTSVHYRLEGYLFPDTYDFYSYDSKTCAELAVARMVKATDEKFTSDMRKRAKDMGYSFHQILTMASIVELESGGTPDEMSNVAAVFYNRLKWDEPKFLGSSPTMDYPYGDGKYDTNITEGLPPGPLCAPSLKSVVAAVNPTPDFAYTYFVTDKDMNFYYNTTLTDHQKTIRTLINQGKWAG